MHPHVQSPQLIGRAAESARLDAALAAAVDGRSAGVLVGGEAGIGKSRLVEEFTTRHRTDLRVLAGGCVEFGADGLPFAPFVAALRGRAELSDDERTRLAPLLPGPADHGDPADEQARPRLFESMLTLLARLSADRPTLLTVEDVHWADRSSIDLLDYLLRNLRAVPGCLVVVTHRSDEPGRHGLRSLLAGAGRLAWVQRITLGRLNRAQVGAQVAGIRGGPPDPELVTAVHRRSEGNPLFVEALLADPAAVPGSLADLLATRVERLAPAAAGLARAAAVGGMRVRHTLLAAVADLTGPELDAAARTAVEAGVLVVDGDGYRFRHALIRDAVLGELLPGERGALHGRYAAALGGRAAGSADNADLAHHLRAAGDARGALAAAAAAAAQAHRSLAHAEQLEFLDQVLQLWAEVPDAAGVIGVDRMTVLHRAAEAAARAGETTLGERLVTEALADPAVATQRALRASLLELRYRLRARSGRQGAGEDLRAALRIAPAQHPVRPYLLNAMAGHLMDGSEPQAARAVAEQALAAALTSGDEPAEAGALITLATLDARAGGLDAQLPRLARARAIADALGAHQLRLRALDREAALLHAYGRLAEAERVARAGLLAAAAAGLARSAGQAHAVNLVWALLGAGRWDEAVESAEHALELAPPDGDQAHLLALQAGVALHRGETHRAGQLAARADELIAGDELLCQEPLLMVGLRTRVRWSGGHPAEAAAELTALLAGRDRLPDSPRVTWPLLVLAARLAAAAPDPALAALVAGTAAALPAPAPPQAAAAHTVTALTGGGRAAWDAAVAAWEELALPLELAEARFGRADALLSAGLDRELAAGDLRRAHAGAEALGAAPLATAAADLARRARIRLDTAAVPVTAMTTGPRLTPREADVLALVAEGLGNAEIGERLFISAKTASVHVSNILGKLEVSNRVEAAAAARRMGLLPA